MQVRLVVALGGWIRIVLIAVQLDLVVINLVKEVSLLRPVCLPRLVVRIVL